mmetsp:Transcript_5841/g.12277  ORF Transcript_5841/g.12277 Transcript_5841/m.12277 type:complete len:472 (-) Transcript_5841:298-1713(-)
MSSSGEPSGSTSDTAQAPVGHYVSPEALAAHGKAEQSAPHWGYEERDGDAVTDDARQACKRERETTLDTMLHEDVQLVPTQREVLQRLVQTLDANTSVVITNALAADNPIVFVTKPWENMCGFSYAQALGRNPRLTQGKHSDPAVIQLMSGALQQQRSCKVMMLNYRSGLQDRPFWNMLSISPIVHSGRLMFYLASLQDYSNHISKLVSLTPTQFCRSAEHFMHPSRMSRSTLSPLSLRQPTVLEANDEFVFSNPPIAQRPPLAGFQMKRLGWTKLMLEPEHLIDRVADCLQTMDARYELSPNTANDDDLFIVNVEVRAVACRILVSRDPSEPGAHRILCSRLGGDTFAYHDFFKELRSLLGDAAEGAGGGCSSALGGHAVSRPSSLVQQKVPRLPLAAAYMPLKDVSQRIVEVQSPSAAPIPAPAAAPFSSAAAPIASLSVASAASPAAAALAPAAATGAAPAASASEAS